MKIYTRSGFPNNDWTAQVLPTKQRLMWFKVSNKSLTKEHRFPLPRLNTFGVLLRPHLTPRLALTPSLWTSEAWAKERPGSTGSTSADTGSPAWLLNAALLSPCKHQKQNPNLLSCIIKLFINQYSSQIPHSSFLSATVRKSAGPFRGRKWKSPASVTGDYLRL